MTAPETPSVVHATFTIERQYPVAPARVFAAWADPALKVRWFHCNADWHLAVYALDFRVGGLERVRTGPAGGPDHAYEATYLDIVPDARIVYAYAMHVGPARISASMATVEFQPAGGGTRMVFTEQGAYLDGHQDPADREHGTALGFENLPRLLAELADA